MILPWKVSTTNFTICSFMLWNSDREKGKPPQLMLFPNDITVPQMTAWMCVQSKPLCKPFSGNNAFTEILTTDKITPCVTEENVGDGKVRWRGRQNLLSTQWRSSDFSNASLHCATAPLECPRCWTEQLFKEAKKFPVNAGKCFCLKIIHFFFFFCKGHVTFSAGWRRGRRGLRAPPKTSKGGRRQSVEEGQSHTVQRSQQTEPTGIQFSEQKPNPAPLQSWWEKSKQRWVTASPLFPSLRPFRSLSFGATWAKYRVHVDHRAFFHLCFFLNYLLARVDICAQKRISICSIWLFAS